MKQILLIAAAVFSLGIIPKAQAQFLDGNKLCELCSVPKNNYAGFGVLMGYVESSADALILSGAACFPPNVIAGQVKDIVCKGLKARA